MSTPETTAVNPFAVRTPNPARSTLIAVRFSSTEAAMLDTLADRAGLSSRSDAIRQAIAFWRDNAPGLQEPVAAAGPITD